MPKLTAHKKLATAGWRILRHIRRNPSSIRKGIGYFLLMGGAATIDRARASLRHHTAGEQEKSIETVASASILTTAKNVLTEASLFEPEILLTDKLIDVGRLPIADGIARNPTIDAWTRLFHSLKAEYKYLVFVPHLMRGGADLVAVNAIRAACERHGTGSTLLVLTDSGQKEALDWLPPPRPNSHYGYFGHCSIS